MQYSISLYFNHTKITILKKTDSKNQTLWKADADSVCRNAQGTVRNLAGPSPNFCPIFSRIPPYFQFSGKILEKLQIKANKMYFSLDNHPY